jgi:hypothetical protein
VCRGKTMVHEWAKLRWGVYEEHGYPGDPKFPIFYWATSWTVNGPRREVGLNFCINSPIVGYEQVRYCNSSCLGIIAFKPYLTKKP